MAGRACVRDVILHTVTPSLRAGVARRRRKIRQEKQEKARNSRVEKSPRVRDGQTSPSMHVKPDIPPTARHGESWNVMAMTSWRRLMVREALISQPLSCV